MSNNAKDIRKQIKNVIQSELPELLNKELSTAAYKQLSAEIQTKLSMIELEVRNTLKQIDERSKDIQDYIIRQSVK